jgi:hypothetical protein
MIKEKKTMKISFDYEIKMIGFYNIKTQNKDPPKIVFGLEDYYSCRSRDIFISENNIKYISENFFKTSFSGSIEFDDIKILSDSPFLKYLRRLENTKDVLIPSDIYLTIGCYGTKLSELNNTIYDYFGGSLIKLKSMAGFNSTTKDGKSEGEWCGLGGDDGKGGEHKHEYDLYPVKDADTGKDHIESEPFGKITIFNVKVSDDFKLLRKSKFIDKSVKEIEKKCDAWTDIYFQMIQGMRNKIRIDKKITIYWIPTISGNFYPVSFIFFNRQRINENAFKLFLYNTIRRYLLYMNIIKNGFVDYNTVILEFEKFKFIEKLKIFGYLLINLALCIEYRNDEFIIDDDHKKITDSYNSSDYSADCEDLTQKMILIYYSFIRKMNLKDKTLLYLQKIGSLYVIFSTIWRATQPSIMGISISPPTSHVNSVLIPKDEFFKRTAFSRNYVNKEQLELFKKIEIEEMNEFNNSINELKIEKKDLKILMLEGTGDFDPTCDDKNPFSNQYSQFKTKFFLNLFRPTFASENRFYSVLKLIITNYFFEKYDFPFTQFATLELNDSMIENKIHSGTMYDGIEYTDFIKKSENWFILATIPFDREDANCAVAGGRFACSPKQHYKLKTDISKLSSSELYEKIITFNILDEYQLPYYSNDLVEKSLKFDKNKISILENESVDRIFVRALKLLSKVQKEFNNNNINTNNRDKDKKKLMYVQFHTRIRNIVENDFIEKLIENCKQKNVIEFQYYIDIFEFNHISVILRFGIF